MPQTYIRADPVTGPTGASCRLNVSKAWMRIRPADSGRTGIGRAFQACMRRNPIQT